MFRISIFVFFTQLLFLTIAAQDGGKETKALNFRVYGLRPGNYEGLYIIDAKNEKIDLVFKRKNRSSASEVTYFTSDPILKIYRDSNEPDPDGNYFPILVAQCRVDPRHLELLLIFSKVRNTKTENSNIEFLVTSMEDSLSRFSTGTIRILNITGVSIIGEAAKTRLELENGEVSSSSPISRNEKTQISIAAKGSTRYHLLYRNSLRTSADSRSLLILRPPAREGSVQIVGHLLEESIVDESAL